MKVAKLKIDVFVLSCCDYRENLQNNYHNLTGMISSRSANRSTFLISEYCYKYPVETYWRTVLSSP